MFLKEGNFNKAIQKATYSINVEKTSKAYFWRGQAYILKNDFESAQNDFKIAKELDPEQQTVIEAEVKRCMKAEKDYDKKQAEKMKNAFSKGI